MPPIIKIPKEKIIETAYQIVKDKGIEGVNARAIAKELHCSIQPIFHNFETMDTLKNHLIVRIQQEYQKYLDAGMQESIPYKGLGKAYIRFAREEPELFRILFMGNQSQSPEIYMKQDQNFNSIIKIGQKATGLDSETMRKLHLDIWVYTHGIAVLSANHTCLFSDSEIDIMLMRAFYGFLSQYKGEKNEKEKCD